MRARRRRGERARQRQLGLGQRPRVAVQPVGGHIDARNRRPDHPLGPRGHGDHVGGDRGQARVQEHTPEAVRRGWLQVERRGRVIREGRVVGAAADRHGVLKPPQTAAANLIELHPPDLCSRVAGRDLQCDSCCIEVCESHPAADQRTVAKEIRSHRARLAHGQGQGGIVGVALRVAAPPRKVVAGIRRGNDADRCAAIIPSARCIHRAAAARGRGKLVLRLPCPCQRGVVGQRETRAGARTAGRSIAA